MRVIKTIPYKPRKWANKFHSSVNRWIVLVLHRRAGKTTAILNHLQKDALVTKKSNYAFIAPTYKQAKRIAWDILKDISRDIVACPDASICDCLLQLCIMGFEE